MASEVDGISSVDDPSSLRERALALFRDKRWIEALGCLDRLVEAQPHSAEMHNYRARALEALDRHEEALHCLDLALRIAPGNVADLRNRGIVLTRLGRLTQALADYDTALGLRPHDPDLLVRGALVLNQIDRREEALEDVDRAVQLRPNDPEILNSRVIVLDNLGRYAQALADIDRMLALQPDHLDAMNNCGMTLARLGRFKDALACYNRSLSLKADQPQAFYNRSLIRLALGDWIRGFQEFESRWNTPPLNKARLQGLGALWLGDDESLYHKTILVYHEQGYGDTLQCVRYVPLLAQRAARVILAVPPALESLMRSLPGVAQVIAGAQELPQHDYQCPLMSLPLALRTTPDMVPAMVPYLAADVARVRAWQLRLGSSSRLRIGIAWGGRRYAPINYPRDIPLAALRPLFSLEADFISLQKEIADSERPCLEALPQLRRLGEGLEHFADTAALMESLDLVITVDTAIAHLAGALAKPVWLMNRYASCWRWLQGRADSPWYPTLRQFRQPTVGDWASVVIAVREAAQSLIHARAMSPRAMGPEAVGQAREIGTGSTAVQLSSGVSATGHRAPRLELPPLREKIRLVSATRGSGEEFFAKAPLGLSLPSYRSFPRHQVIELRLFANNREGLSSIYNTAIDEARSNPAILVFIHDDVYLNDFYWTQHLHEALEHFDLVGLAGNRRRVPRQASWMYLDGQFTRDNPDNLSGVLGHGAAFPNLRQLSVYGEPGREVKLLDGVMMAIRSRTLIERDLRFDPRFKFDFYDLDFCRQAQMRGLRMGTWAISIVHASAGAFGGESWQAAYREYLVKYDEE